MYDSTITFAYFDAFFLKISTVKKFSLGSGVTSTPTGGVFPPIHTKIVLGLNIAITVPVPYMDTLRKIKKFHPRIHVIGLQKCMTTITGLLTIFKKNYQPCKFSSLILMIKTKKFYKYP